MTNGRQSAFSWPTVLQCVSNQQLPDCRGNVGLVSVKCQFTCVYSRNRHEYYIKCLTIEEVHCSHVWHFVTDFSSPYQTPIPRSFSHLLCVALMSTEIFKGIHIFVVCSQQKQLHKKMESYALICLKYTGIGNVSLAKVLYGERALGLPIQLICHTLNLMIITIFQIDGTS